MRLDRDYLGDLLETAGAIERTLQGQTRESFVQNELLRKAILLDLITIGEAVAGVSSELKAKFPDVGWARIVRFRNRVVHGYFSLDWAIVWDTATANVPVLASQVREILERY